MHDMSTSQPLLSYEPRSESGDVRAGRVLRSIVGWILRFQICLDVLAIGLGLAYLGWANNLSWNVLYGLGLTLLLILLRVACLLSIARQGPRRNTLFTITFLIATAMTPAISVAGWSQGVVVDSVNFASMSANNILTNSYLLLVPLLLGKESDIWLRRLNWLSAGLLALLLNSWLRGIAIRFFYPSQRNIDDAIFIRPDWLLAGVIVSVVALIALRREFNRVLIRLVGAWLILFAVMHLKEPARSLITFHFSFASLFILIEELEHYAFVALPLGFLVWFTYRFTDDERREMGRRVQPAIIEPLPHG